MQTLTCSITGKKFSISDHEEQFLREIDMPPMPICPEERLRQLMASRNEWKLYRRKCDATGADIVSAYPPDSPYKVYRRDIWWGDSWEALDYGRTYDFNRSFFDQFYDLQLAAPREGTSVFESENCEFNSHVRQSKNSYMNSLMVGSEDTHYSYWMVHCESTLDSCFHIAGKSTLCYECIDFGNCYDCIAAHECQSCSSALFSFQMKGCDHCLFCSNLANKSYRIRNKPCTPEEFEKARAAILSGSHTAWEKAYEEFLNVRLKAIHRSSHSLNCENVTGDHLINCRNCMDAFDGDESEDCEHSISINNAKDVYSCHSAGWPSGERLWHCSVTRGCNTAAMCRYLWASNDMWYCDSCQTCNHCFGCIGLRHKEYCILNKQYTKEEYEAMLQKIKAHMKRNDEWGAFFPLQTLPFSYNQSAAQDYYPLTKEEALRHGFTWRDEVEAPPDVKKVLEAKDVPDALSEVTDDILQTAIRCEATGKPFRIIKQELDFYRRMHLPLPRLHSEERHKERMALRNPFKLWARTCDHCNKEIQTTYATDRPETIYCEECYRDSVYV